MTRQLYDYWFVQFDFPDENGRPYKSSGGEMVWNEKLKREIPVGWKDGQLIDISSITMGQSPDGSSYNETGDGILFYQGSTDFGIRFPSVRQYTNSPTRFAKKGDILMSVRAPVGTVNIANNDCCIGRGLAALNSKIGSLTHLYFIIRDLKTAFDNKNAVGTTFGSITKDELYSMPVVIPSTNVIERFENMCSPVFERQMIIGKEIDDLISQREELLPLLMNGQVSVKQLNNHFEERDKMLSSTFSKPKCMKEEFTQLILKEMDGLLTKEQLSHLQIAIQSVLDGYNLERQMTDLEQQKRDKEQLLIAFLSAKKVEGCSEKTLDYYRATLSKMLTAIDKGITQITTNDIRQYLSDFKESRGSSKVTIDNIRRIFSSFFSWLEDEDYIPKNPVRRIHRVRADSLVKEIINDEAMEILRDSCTKMRDLAMIDLLASTGMRVGELVRMNISDIDFQERQCVVFGKGNKERTVYFNARTKIHLNNYIRSRTDNNPSLFVSFSEPFNRLSISGVEKRLRLLGERVHITKVHPHKFRRTLATTAIDRGMPIEQVQKLLGHVKIDTTLHYALVGQNNVKISHRKIIG